MKHDSPPVLPIGARIRALRLDRRLSLADLAHGTGVSEATMSRIETGQSNVSAPHLYGLARLLGVDIATFFAESSTALHPGFRTLTRANSGQRFQTPRLFARLLAEDLLNKRMHPFLNTVTATDLAKVGGLLAHEGEEFLFVLRGPMLFLSAGYAPLPLSTGDSLYFDASHPHAYLAATTEGADFLVVSSTEAPDALTQDLTHAE